MTAPALAVYQTGGPAVTGDNLNTFVQSADTMADLRALVGVAGLQVFVRGTAAPGDGGQGNFYWNVNGTAPDDNGVTTVLPYGSGSGEWTRLTGSGFGSNTLFPSSTTVSTTSTSAAIMGGLNQTFVPAASGRFLIFISGTIRGSTVGDGGSVQLWYGTGTPPSEGAPTAGTAINASESFGAAEINQVAPFTLQGYVSGLSVGTTYWADVSVIAFTGGTVTLYDFTVSIAEL